MMNKYKLPTSIEINGIECEFESDFSYIIEIMKILSDPDLLEGERTIVALDYFYKTDDYKIDINKAIDNMFLFISGGNREEKSSSTSEKPLYDWDKDFSIIINPINKMVGQDIRGLEHFHWWTFLSYFMEIGECTFSTFVSIRNKLNKGTKLEKYEEKIYKENKDRIVLQKKYDSTTQALMDEIMGRR